MLLIGSGLRHVSKSGVGLNKYNVEVIWSAPERPERKMKAVKIIEGCNELEVRALARADIKTINKKMNEIGRSDIVVHQISIDEA